MASLALTAGSETMWSYGGPGHVSIVLILVYALLYPWTMAFFNTLFCIVPSESGSQVMAVEICGFQASTARLVRLRVATGIHRVPLCMYGSPF
jgi:hypothetical protein